MMQVWVQGCPTLYKSQVVLSIKDTPLVPKLRIKSQHDGVLDRPPVVLLPATRLLEAVGGVKRPRRGVRLAHFEVHLSHAAGRQGLENALHERASQPAAPSGRGHGEIQDLALVGRLERDDVAYDRSGSFRLGDEKVRIGRHAVAKVLCGPRVGEDLLLD